MTSNAITYLKLAIVGVALVALFAFAAYTHETVQAVTTQAAALVGTLVLALGLGKIGDGLTVAAKVTAQAATTGEPPAPPAPSAQPPAPFTERDAKSDKAALITAITGATVMVVMFSSLLIVQACGSSPTPASSPEDTAARYLAEQLACVDKAHTIEESRACRADVKARYGR